MTNVVESGTPLQSLPTEILINILSHLDEKDLYAVQATCKHFRDIINDEELWKNLFVSRINTRLFPSFSRSLKYSVEYVERNRGLNEWRHNRAIKTKYTVATQNQYNQLEQMVFDYPRCACYSDGVIMLVQLHSRRRKDRLTYMPCTTPHGCSTMHFNINAAVFGRYDGRVFGKLLTNKSHLCPVTEFNAMHRSCVTAITTAALEDSSEDWCVSGCETGQVIWWCEAKMRKSLQISNKPILRLALHKDWTVAMDSEHICIVRKMDTILRLDIPLNLRRSPNQIQFFKVDFGGRLLVLGDTSEIFVISIDVDQDFGHTRSLQFENSVQNVFIDEATTKRTQDASIAGGDGCFMGVLTADNSIHTVNIRTPGSNLCIQTKLTFVDEVHVAQINNLVLVCAFSGSLGIFDAANGSELRVVRKTEKIPQFLGVSHGRMIVGSGNVLHFLQYAGLEDKQKKTGSSQITRSNKWNEVLHSQLDLYNEDERSRLQEQKRLEKLRQKFLGDIDDEETQLKIALMESEAAAMDVPSSIKEESPAEPDEDLLRAIEESRLSFENSMAVEEQGEDNELLRAIQQSREEEESRRTSRRSQRRMAPLGELVGSSSSELQSTRQGPHINSLFAQPQTPEVSSNQPRHFEDEELELAKALSLSELH
ncbi:LAQU0S04e10572g1_1 [Lachancea quebecensis]|uniref:LAQU0S04e10572g1_1 n=1 Tax=Lachancea quebecensis TaxID=1654605 RepID=A0A0P1KQ58_9SACH|nr:LAQU0S04e10572g1_1 [Lachancea quebecensis]